MVWKRQAIFTQRCSAKFQKNGDLLKNVSDEISDGFLGLSKSLLKLNSLKSRLKTEMRK
jgi:hypothetical protein